MELTIGRLVGRKRGVITTMLENWLTTAFSVALATNDKLLTGLKFSKTRSRPYFFKIGVRMATFHESGT